MAKKQRLDIILVKDNYFKSREKARQIIMTGNVWVDGKRVDKPGNMIAPDSKIEIKDTVNPYVSRGGLKMEKAINQFNIDVINKTVIDIGASTGGFTDCLLKNGAIKVYAVDVGYGQLDWNLRNDPRVVVMERKNARYLSRNDLPCICDMATVDVSFISLKHIFPTVVQLVKNDGVIVCLIKPQFEANREHVKKGVVKDPKIHFDVIERVLNYANKSGLNIYDLTFSPVKGPKGNIEFLGLFSSVCSKHIDITQIQVIIEEAHKALK